MIIVNAARGGIVDEQALYAALKEGRVAAAGVDVFAKEPCTDSPLFELDNVVVTPHLGASTDEAQEKAGIAVAKSVRLALSGELVPDAVNVQGGAVPEDVRPALPLVEHLGRVVTALSGGIPAAVARRGPGRDQRAGRRDSRVVGAEGTVRRSGRRARDVRQRPAPGQEQGRRGVARPRRPRAPTSATSSRCAPSSPMARCIRWPAPSRARVSARRSSPSTASTSTCCSPSTSPS